MALDRCRTRAPCRCSWIGTLSDRRALVELLPLNGIAEGPLTTGVAVVSGTERDGIEVAVETDTETETETEGETGGETDTETADGRSAMATGVGRSTEETATRHPRRP